MLVNLRIGGGQEEKIHSTLDTIVIVFSSPLIFFEKRKIDANVEFGIFVGTDEAAPAPTWTEKTH